jgi:hypothetical protein
MLDKLNPGAGNCTKIATPATPPGPPPRPAWPPQKITGQKLAKGRWTKAQRINLAEALHAGNVEVTKPTMKLSAIMARVALTDVYRARRPKPKPRSLAEHLVNSSPAERIEAARALGVDVVWDTMIAPIVADERGEVVS